jgi:hypothetical protein
MEIPALPQPPSGDYSLQILATLGTILLLSIGFGIREYLRYRDKRESEDKEFRDKQIALQQAQYDKESDKRDKFRAAFEATTNERFDEIGTDAKTFANEIRDIIKAQQDQISALKLELAELKWEKRNNTPPKEGG